MKQLLFVVCFVALGFRPLCTKAQPVAEVVPVADESANYQVQTILSDLDNPCGLAVRSTRAKNGPYDLFLAESGKGRILRLSTTDPDKFQEAVVGFPTNEFNDHLPYRVGPLGLAFLTARSKLIVGDSGQPSGGDQLSVYILPADGKPLDAAERDHAVGLQENRAGADTGSVNFLAMAKSHDLVYLSVGGDGNQGVLLKAGIKSNRLAYLQPLPMEGSTRRFARGGIALIPPPQPPYLVVGEIGSFETPRDSALAFYIPATGELAMRLPTDLHDMMGLAYSPSGQLYATDFAWSDEGAGGVYRLDDIRTDGKQDCRAVRIAAVAHPMSLVFTPNGELYVTAFGTGENEQQGMLLKITGDF